MAAVSVRDLKDHLGEHLRRVQGGQRILVTERGRPIAEISPLRPEPTTLEERLARMEAEGEITLPRGKKAPGRVQPVRVRGRPVAETLLEDRR
jgi:prevent-host-death family protein